MLGSLLPSSRLPQGASLPDKVIHFAIYFVLAFFLTFGLAKQTRWPRIRRNAPYVAFGVCLVYGSILEIIQGTLIPSRAFEWLDFLANAGGAAVVIPIFWMICGNVFDKK